MKQARITIVTGAVNAGKTTKIKALVEMYKNSGCTIAGFYSEKVFENNVLIAYNLVLLATKKVIPFLSLTSFGTTDRIGPYFINTNAFDFVSKELLNTNATVLIMDEIGRLELDGKGFNLQLTQVLNTFDGELVLAVRNTFLDAVIAFWELDNPTIIKIQKPFKLN